MLLKILLLGYLIALCACAHFGSAKKLTEKSNIKSQNNGFLSQNVPKRIVIGSKPGMTSFSFNEVRSYRAPVSRPKPSKPNKPVHTTTEKKTTTHTVRQTHSRQFQQNVPKSQPRIFRHTAPPPSPRFKPQPPPQQSFNLAPPPQKSFNQAPPPQQSFNQAPPPQKSFNQAPPPQQSFNQAPPPQQSFNQAPPPPQRYQPPPPPQPPRNNVPMPPPNGSRPPVPPPNQGSGFHYQTVVASNNPNNAQKLVFTATAYQAYPQGNTSSDLHGHVDKDRHHNISYSDSMVVGANNNYNQSRSYRMHGERGSSSGGKSVMATSVDANDAAAHPKNNANKAHAQNLIHHFRIPVHNDNKKLKSQNISAGNTHSSDRVSNIEALSVYRRLIAEKLDKLLATMPIFSFKQSLTQQSVNKKTNQMNFNSGSRINNILQDITRLDIMPYPNVNMVNTKYNTATDQSFMYTNNLQPPTTNVALQKNSNINAWKDNRNIRGDNSAASAIVSNEYTKSRESPRDSQQTNVLSGMHKNRFINIHRTPSNHNFVLSVPNVTNEKYKPKSKSSDLESNNKTKIFTQTRPPSYVLSFPPTGKNKALMRPTKAITTPSRVPHASESTPHIASEQVKLFDSTQESAQNDTMSTTDSNFTIAFDSINRSMQNISDLQMNVTSDQDAAYGIFGNLTHNRKKSLDMSSDNQTHPEVQPTVIEISENTIDTISRINLSATAVPIPINILEQKHTTSGQSTAFSTTIDNSLVDLAMPVMTNSPLLSTVGVLPKIVPVTDSSKNNITVSNGSLNAIPVATVSTVQKEQKILADKLDVEVLSIPIKQVVTMTKVKPSTRITDGWETPLVGSSAIHASHNDNFSKTNLEKVTKPLSTVSSFKSPVTETPIVSSSDRPKNMLQDNDIINIMNSHTLNENVILPIPIEHLNPSPIDKTAKSSTSTVDGTIQHKVHLPTSFESSVSSINSNSENARILEMIGSWNQKNAVTSPNTQSILPHESVLSYFAPGLMTGFGSKDRPPPKYQRPPINQQMFGPQPPPPRQPPVFSQHNQKSQSTFSAQLSPNNAVQQNLPVQAVDQTGTSQQTSVQSFTAPLNPQQAAVQTAFQQQPQNPPQAQPPAPGSGFGQISPQAAQSNTHVQTQTNVVKSVQSQATSMAAAPGQQPGQASAVQNPAPAGTVVQQSSGQTSAVPQTVQQPPGQTLTVQSAVVQPQGQPSFVQTSIQQVPAQPPVQTGPVVPQQAVQPPPLAQQPAVPVSQPYPPNYQLPPPQPRYYPRPQYQPPPPYQPRLPTSAATKPTPKPTPKPTTTTTTTTPKPPPKTEAPEYEAAEVEGPTHAPVPHYYQQPPAGQPYSTATRDPLRDMLYNYQMYDLFFT